MSARIRRAEPGDAKALVALARAIGAEPEGWLVTDGAWRSVAEERRFLRAARRSPHVAVLVAESLEGIVGRLSAARDGHPASFHVADVGLMVALSVRRHGVGRALLVATEEWAHRQRISKLELHVFPHNKPAIALYESMGYRQEGLRRRHYERRGELVDAILMAKEL